MRAIGKIVRARRNQFDRVGTEHRQIANVLIPCRNGPGIIGIGFRAIAKLMAAQAIGGSGRDVGK